MTKTYRPGVYSQYDIISQRRSLQDRYAFYCGAAKVREGKSIPAGGVVQIHSRQELEEYFDAQGGALFCAVCGILLDSGVSGVYAVPLTIDGTAAAENLYEPAIQKLCEVKRSGVILCDSQAQTVLQKLVEQVQLASQNERERLAVGGVAKAQAQQIAKALNCERLVLCGIRALFFSSITNPCTRFVNSIVYACVGVFGAIAAISGSLSVGMLTCFLTYANQYTKPFNEIAGVAAELQSAIASAARVFELIDAPWQEPDAPDAQPLARADGSVEIRDVAFSYRQDVPLIENLNLAAQPGQRIAIVGPTGCGKTTIINLLMRFYDVNRGEIRVSGRDARSLPRDNLRAQFGMVLQDTWLKTGTIRENIAYGRPDATEEEIVFAAKAAHADGFIRRLPQGYDTMVSDEEGGLSQGQRQLLCIARVMLTLPPMLILDEATSSIDTRTESLIQRAFDRMMQGRTSFIVAHRLSTIRGADCILVMRDGHIVEQGRHEELLEKGGFYAELYNSQFAP